MRIEMVVFDGFDELDVFGPLEVLKLAAGIGAPFDVRLVGADGPGEITAQHGTRLIVAGGLGAGDLPPDAVIVPGGGWLNRAPAGSWAQALGRARPWSVDHRAGGRPRTRRRGRRQPRVRLAQ